MRERTIEDIIKSVSIWRRLYNGIRKEVDGQEALIRYTLKDAAKKVGIPKKSLDDYLLQIRTGIKYNFNFQERKNDKVGELRNWIKKVKLEEKRQLLKQGKI